jgi:hypothetical protein
MEDLTQVIEDAITDVEIAPEALEDTTTSVDDPTPIEPVEVAPTASNEPTEPVKETVPPVQDEVDPFDKKFGLTKESSLGKENRIPYSRVRKIVDKAVKEAETAKADAFKTYVEPTKFKEYEDKVKDYEGRLTQIAEFEKVMINDHGAFLTMLANKIPGYAQILAPLFNPPTEQSKTAPPPSQTDPSVEMPQPDQTLTDGSKVYSMEGLKALMAWQAAQVEAKVTKQVEERVSSRYKPIEDSFTRHQRVQEVLPKVRAQIEEARKWPLFGDNEDEITKTLQENPTYNLERAYQAVVLPKLQAQRDQMRADILKEVKQAPRSTGVSTAATKPNPVSTSTGPRALEDVIADSIKDLKR